MSDDKYYVFVLCHINDCDYNLINLVGMYITR